MYLSVICRKLHGYDQLRTIFGCVGFSLDETALPAALFRATLGAAERPLNQVGA